MSQTLEVDVIKVHCSKLLEVQKTFKEEIRKLKEESVFNKYLEDKDLEALTKFNDNDQTYFEFNTYQSDHITQLNTAIDAYYNSLYDGYFKIKNLYWIYREKLKPNFHYIFIHLYGNTKLPKEFFSEGYLNPKDHFEADKDVFPDNRAPKAVIFCYEEYILEYVKSNYKVSSERFWTAEIIILQDEYDGIAIVGNFGIGGPASTHLFEILIALGIENYIMIGHAGGLQK